MKSFSIRIASRITIWVRSSSEATRQRPGRTIERIQHWRAGSSISMASSDKHGRCNGLARPVRRAGGRVMGPCTARRQRDDRPPRRLQYFTMTGDRLGTMLHDRVPLPGAADRCGAQKGDQRVVQWWPKPSISSRNAELSCAPSRRRSRVRVPSLPLRTRPQRAAFAGLSRRSGLGRVRSAQQRSAGLANKKVTAGRSSRLPIGASSRRSSAALKTSAWDHFSWFSHSRASRSRSVAGVSMAALCELRRRIVELAELLAAFRQRVLGPASDVVRRFG
jgi:hypothetical protein